MSNFRERNWRQAKSRIDNPAGQRAGGFSFGRGTLETDPHLGRSAGVAYTAARRDPHGMLSPRRARTEDE